MMTSRPPPPENWANTTNAHRKRKMTTLTLSAAARARLVKLAQDYGSMSAAAEAAINALAGVKARGAPRKA